MKSIPYSEIRISSREDDEAAILSVFETLRANNLNVEFSFLNIYKEIPVSNNVKYLTSKTRKLNSKSLYYSLP